MLSSLTKIFDRNTSYILDISLVNNYTHEPPFWFETCFNPISLALFFELYWHYTIYIGFLYLICMYFLKQWMKTRAPFQLKKQLFVWNAALSVFSYFGAVRCSQELIHTLTNHGLYTAMCLTFDYRTTMAHWCAYFCVSKAFELMDTVFLVLRKRPTSFLHCWHHFSVMIYSFHSGSEFMASSRIFMWMNFCAHSFMYTYFSVMSLGIRIPKPIAKFITVIQILQMVVGVTTSLFIFFAKTFLEWPCQQTDANIYLSFFIYGSYMILFINYFIQTYVKKSNAKTKAQ